MPPYLTFSFDGITKMEKYILTSNQIALSKVIMKSPYIYKETWVSLEFWFEFHLNKKNGLTSVTLTVPQL